MPMPSSSSEMRTWSAIRDAFMVMREPGSLYFAAFVRQLEGNGVRSLRHQFTCNPVRGMSTSSSWLRCSVSAAISMARALPQRFQPVFCAGRSCRQRYAKHRSRSSTSRVRVRPVRREWPAGRVPPRSRITSSVVLMGDNGLRSPCPSIASYRSFIRFCRSAALQPLDLSPRPPPGNPEDNQHTIDLAGTVTQGCVQEVEEHDFDLAVAVAYQVHGHFLASSSAMPVVMTRSSNSWAAKFWQGFEQRPADDLLRSSAPDAAQAGIDSSSDPVLRTAQDRGTGCAPASAVHGSPAAALPRSSGRSALVRVQLALSAELLPRVRGRPEAVT